MHATLKQRLNAVHQLRLQHDIKTLCRVLHVNRSSYYKHFNAHPSPRIKENQHIPRLILHIYADYDNCIGAYKMTHILSRDYGISISSGRVYRLMRSMTLPKPSTVKPKRNPQKDSGECHDLLRR